MNELPPKDEMDRAMLDRDVSYDGIFITAVRTTGVFCRPSCPARKPNLQNVEYYRSARDALLNGYRPCKRCRPMELDGRTPEWVEPLLARLDHVPRDRLTDADLRCLDINPSRARRYFRNRYGMTFQAYHRARRMGLALRDVQGGNGDMAVAMNHGYESVSGFRDAFIQTFLEPPGHSRDVRCIMTRTVRTPLGVIVAGATDTGACLLEFADRPALPRQIDTLRKRLRAVFVPGHNRHLDRLADEVDRYFRGTLKTFSVPLDMPGTSFQQAVWGKLRDIPYGVTCSYGELARDLGRPGAQRAVGRANGDNRLAIVVPCHRVVQCDGQLRGYGGGLWRKRYLLDLEQQRHLSPI